MRRTFNFPLVNNFDEGDVLLKDGINGTKTILAANAIPSNSDLIHVLDTAGNFASDNVEGALAESAGKIAGVQVGTGILGRAIAPYQTSFVDCGKNKYDKDAAVLGFQVSIATGVIEANADYYLSQPIPVLPNTTYVRVWGEYAVAYFDSSYVQVGFIRPGHNLPFTTPATAKYVRITNYKTTLDTEQFEIGSTPTTYEAYKIMMPKYTSTDAYPFQPYATLIDSAKKAIIKKAVKRIELYGADNTKKYALGILQKKFTKYGTGIYIAECNNDGTFNKYVCVTAYDQYVIPVGTTVFNLDVYLGSSITAKVWIDWNEIPDNTQYVTNTYDKGGLDARTFSSILSIPEVIDVNLPTVLNAVVGDTLEIFYKGIVQAVDPFKFNIKVVSSQGNAYKKRWIYTPSSAIADFTLTIGVYDNQNNILASKIATIKTSAVKTSPLSPKNILCIGDSLTSAGTWVREFDRRLTESVGSPAGNELNNIDFIGAKTNGTSGYEGHSGWTWQMFNSNIATPFYWNTVTVGMKTEAISQESIWSDGTNQWQLGELDADNDKIKFKQYPLGGTYAMPTSGTLTFVSGGGDTANIVYSETVAESGNPFWNVTTSALDFNNYCTENSYSGIDYAFILLGWNNTGLTGTQIVTEGKVFVDKLHTDYPDCKVVIVGLQVPSIDGLGANYGANSSWNYYEKLQKVFEFNTAYENWTKEATYSSYMSFVHLSSQFDTDNNMPSDTRAVNVRNAATELYGTNGVHPATEGYYQIADACYRNIMSLL